MAANLYVFGLGTFFLLLAYCCKNNKVQERQEYLQAAASAYDRQNSIRTVKTLKFGSSDNRDSLQLG